MGWFYTVIGFGLLAFVCFVSSAVCKLRNNSRMGVLFGFLELLCAAISSSAWAWALKVSGKGDWFLFGILGYPMIGWIFYAMFVVGIGCAAVNIWGLRKQGGSSNSVEKG